MKTSPLLLSITWITLIALTATTLYAQTATGTSVINKMKSAVSAFTLAGELNPGQTGLQSAPVSGKKTGDILTAGEWNRVLELVADGSSTGSVNYLQLTTPASVTFTEGGKVPFTTLVSQKGSKITQSGGEVTLKGGSSYRISADLRLTSPNSGIGYTIVDKSVWTGVGVFGANYTGTLTDSWGGTSALAIVSPTVDTTYFIKTSSLSWTPYSTSAGWNFTVEELWGGSGGSSAGGSVQIVEWGIIKTSAKTISNWDLITLEGSWNWGSDAAPSGGYIYKLGGQPKLSYVEASGISKDITLTTTAQNVHNLTVRLSGDSVIIDPSTTNTLAYVVWKFGGGSSSTSSGWIDVPLADTADYDTNCEYRFQMNKAMLDGVWSFGSPTPAGNHYYYATYVADNIITASGTYNVMHGIPKATKNKMFLYWVNGTGVDSSANYSIAKIQKRCN